MVPALWKLNFFYKNDVFFEKIDVVQLGVVHFGQKMELPRLDAQKWWPLSMKNFRKFSNNVKNDQLRYWVYRLIGNFFFRKFPRKYRSFLLGGIREKSFLEKKWRPFFLLLPIVFLGGGVKKTLFYWKRSFLLEGIKQTKKVSY